MEGIYIWERSILTYSTYHKGMAWKDLDFSNCNWYFNHDRFFHLGKSAIKNNISRHLIKSY
jgi:hypothetical protein